MIFGFLGGRLAERWSERAILIIGLVMAAAGSLGLLVTALLHLPLTAVILSLFTMVGGVADTTVTTPNGSALSAPAMPTVACLGLARARGVR